MIQKKFPKNVSQKELSEAAKSMIFSSSGLRKVFASHEESSLKSISRPDMLLLLLIAESFTGYIKGTFDEPCTIVIGRDSRPTGGFILRLLESVFSARGLATWNLDIVPTPEISAYTARNDKLCGYCYVSASHNPVGYNGIKFGGSDGAVLPPEIAKELIADIHHRIETYTPTNKPLPLLRPSASRKWKRASEKAYWDFLLEQSSQNDPPAADSLGLVVDMNGSARARSIDLKWLDSLGLRVETLYAKSGKIAHRIEPEGDALVHCAHALERAYKKDPRFLFGYVYDNDGDRGNILVYNRVEQKTLQLSPQLHLALIVMIELAWMECVQSHSKPALVINAPTSYRVDEIAKCFSVRVFRSEVGEANVLKKVRALEKEGYHVHIAGEGSNGGCIVLPGKVRDPLVAITAIVKLYAMRLFSLWCKRSHNIFRHSHRATLPDIIKTLPCYSTSSSGDENARLRLNCDAVDTLKEEYEKVFQKEFPLKEKTLRARLGVQDWYQENYLEDVALRGVGAWKKMKSPTGGLAIVFTNSKKKVVASMWFRKSGTEPIFRSMVDVRGSEDSYLKSMLAWQRDMLVEADRRAQKRLRQDRHDAPRVPANPLSQASQ